MQYPDGQNAAGGVTECLIVLNRNSSDITSVASLLHVVSGKRVRCSASAEQSCRTAVIPIHAGRDCAADNNCCQIGIAGDIRFSTRSDSINGDSRMC